MPRWIGVLVVAIILFLLAGMGLTMRQRLRIEADIARCQNHLREQALFAGRFVEATPRLPALTNEIPAGTVVNANLAVEERLSWYATSLPWLDQHRLPASELALRLDRTQAWNSRTNAEVGRLKLPMLQCPGLPPEVGEGDPAPTSYFGNAGLGVDAASLRVRQLDLHLGVFGDWQPWLVPGGAGCFRYDVPTPFAAIRDGLAQTILLGEREPSPGPWLQGGSATVRGFDLRADAPPAIGVGGQFGGGHAAIANFAYADGHAAPLSLRVDPRVLLRQLTIADGSELVDP